MAARRLAVTHLPDDLMEAARDVAPDEQLRVHDQPGRQAMISQFHGDRVDQERHIVGDDVDHIRAAGKGCIAAGPDLHQRAPLRPPGRELGMPDRDRRQPGWPG